MCPKMLTGIGPCLLCCTCAKNTLNPFPPTPETPREEGLWCRCGGCGAMPPDAKELIEAEGCWRKQLRRPRGLGFKRIAQCLCGFVQQCRRGGGGGGATTTTTTTTTVVVVVVVVVAKRRRTIVITTSRVYIKNTDQNTCHRRRCC